MEGWRKGTNCLVVESMGRKSTDKCIHMHMQID